MLNFKRVLRLLPNSYKPFSFERNPSISLITNKFNFSMNLRQDKQQKFKNKNVKENSTPVKTQISQLTSEKQEFYQQQDLEKINKNLFNRNEFINNLKQIVKWHQITKLGLLTSFFLLVVQYYLNDVNNKHSTQYTIEKTKQDKKKMLQEQQQQFRMKFIQFPEYKILKNPFVKYQQYKNIEELFIRQIYYNDYAHNKMWIIQGLPGIGKTTAMQNLIYNFTKGDGIGQKKIKIKDIKEKDTQIYYASLKGNQNQSSSIQKSPQDKESQYINEVFRLMKILNNRADENQSRNIVLIIDQLNQMCKQKYKQKIKSNLRGNLQRMKIIGLSSCSQSTEQWIKWNMGFNNRITLKPNNPRQIKQFLKHQLGKQITIQENILQIISNKFSTFRQLASKISEFKNIHKIKNFLNINQQFIKFIYPLQIKTFERVKLKITQIINIQPQILKDDLKYFYLLYKLILFNQLVGVLVNEYYLATGQKLNYQSFEQFKKKNQQIVPAYVNFQTIYLMRQKLQLQNILFSIILSEEAKRTIVCAKNEEMRQYIYYYLKEQRESIYPSYNNDRQLQQLMNLFYRTCKKNSQLLQKFIIWQYKYGLRQAIIEDEKLKNQKL